MINEIDHYGYALIHYFTEIDYYECIKAIAKNGGDVNLRAQNDSQSSPLFIAAARGHEKSV